MDARTMAEAQGRGRLGNFLLGLGAATGILALSLLLLFLPPVGTLVMVTFAPLAAGYYGARAGRMGLSSGWLLLGATAGSIWSLVNAAIILALLSGVMGTADPLEPFGLLLLLVISGCNIVFCIVGARLGAASRGAN
jgi:hypothetical protein